MLSNRRRSSARLIKSVAAGLSDLGGRKRRWLLRGGVAIVSTVALVGVAVAANATDQTTVHSSATDQNSCIATFDPAGEPPTQTPATVTITTDAFPEPHNGDPITLSNTTIDVSIPADLVQPGVDAQLISDNQPIATTISPTLAGSNTVEGTHAFSVDTTAIAHVVGGLAEPLTASVNLPDTTWTPVDASAPVVFTEQSLQIVGIVDDSLQPSGVVLTVTIDCTSTTTPTIVALTGASTTTTGPTTTTSTPTSCNRPGYGYGDKNHTHCGPPGRGKHTPPHAARIRSKHRGH